ncbi:metallophosphoesterase [Candidatus Woesearchaeota archaeon]|nr:metallophosphoesterase [Candidatus Woesearchaeota archaeon]
MKIGVISDTHDQRLRILEAIDIFNKEKVELVIHCGDWVSPFSAARFSALKCNSAKSGMHNRVKPDLCPIKGVFGNNDGDKDMHKQRNGNFIEYHDKEMEIVADGRKIFVTHGHISQLVENALKSGNYDAVFSGHTHVAHVKNEGKTLWLNPGTLVDETNEKTKGMSIAVYDTATNTAKLIKLK